MLKAQKHHIVLAPPSVQAQVKAKAATSTRRFKRMAAACQDGHSGKKR